MFGHTEGLLSDWYGLPEPNKDVINIHNVLALKL